MDLLGGGNGGQQQQQQIEATATTMLSSSAANCPCPFGAGGMEKPGSANPAAAESGGSVGMSRPSLISSLWSIQVQNEGSSSDFPMAGCGSQQSLPEMLSQAGATLPFGGHQHCNGFAGVGPSLPGAILSGCCAAPGFNQMQASAEMVGDGPHQMDLQTGTAIIGQSSGSMMGGQVSLRPVKSLSDLHTLTAAQIAQTAAVMPCPLHFHQQPPIQQPNDQSYYLGFRRQTETGPYYTTMLSRQQRDSQICEWLQKLNMNGGGGGGGGSTTGGGSESPSQEFYQQQRPPFLRADTTEQ